jgi:hypothetical protein
MPQPPSTSLAPRLPSHTCPTRQGPCTSASCRSAHMSAWLCSTGFTFVLLLSTQLGRLARCVVLPLSRVFHSQRLTVPSSCCRCIVAGTQKCSQCNSPTADSSAQYACSTVQHLSAWQANSTSKPLLHADSAAPFTCVEVPAFKGTSAQPCEGLAVFVLHQCLSGVLGCHSKGVSRLFCALAAG